MNNQSVKEFDRAGSRIAADFRAMIADSEDLLKAAATMSGDGLAAARVKFEEKVSRAKTALADASQPMIDKTREGAAAVNGYVHDKPWSAVGVAAAAGLLVGFLVAKR
jgi:ElaB/YqjD/DUF883 family membrane-anchored ribosome-binding protein